VNIPLCHHFKKNGELCRSPALRGCDYCYFHIGKQNSDIRTLQMLIKLAILMNKMRS